MNATLTTKDAALSNPRIHSESLSSGQPVHLQAPIDIVPVRVDPTISGHLPHFVR
jgi:hypothetical protein